MPPAVRIRPYKDFLTPALHRRFALATAVLAAVCYVEAVWIGEWKSFLWSWFPLGRAGIRTGLFFLCGFMIFILRVAQLHVGIRTSNSSFHTFTQYAPKFQTVQTALWYLFSAWFFSEVYIWSVPESTGLNRIKLAAKTSRPILNEKPIYLTMFLLLNAIVQAGFHLWYDYDRIDIPLTKTGPEVSSEQPSHTTVLPITQLKAKALPLAISCLKRVAVMAVVSPFIYSVDISLPIPFILPVFTFNIRESVWGFTRSFAKIFWNLPKAATPPNELPFHWTMVLRTIIAGLMLTLLWEFGNLAFSIYVAQAPLKNDRPITYESRDPNGSLLTGLKGKKLQTRAFAFWELVEIAQRYQGRRKAIFEDIDRVGGSAWSQILAACLETIDGIIQRIEEYDPKKQPPVINIYEEQEPLEPVSTLPRLLTAPLKDEPKGGLVEKPQPVETRSRRYLEAIGSFAKSQGELSPPDKLSRSRQLKADKKRAAIQAALPTQSQQPEGLQNLLREQAIKILKTPLGRSFRQEYRKEIASVVLGMPHGDIGIIIDAIDSITRFAMCSLVEDKYGKVQKDIKDIVETYTKTIVKVQKFRTKLGAHWTDVEGRQESPEVDLLLAVLKSGLRELVEGFGDYSVELKINPTGLRAAREAMNMAPPRQEDMEQRRR
ncbi:nuclear envelope protein [Sclerotinia borealis F-4128]|uniref:Nuclear envelope protein n=1 Tax=Sclerotinia borealis (strain F-4128) TaxID=1432307 RepID=W9CM43_SCLBF|nr:nuclear envelope protein [Sclerotinia borealis F-4128]